MKGFPPAHLQLFPNETAQCQVDSLAPRGEGLRNPDGAASVCTRP